MEPTNGLVLNGGFGRDQTIRRALVSGGVPAVLELVGVCRNDADSKRPDGMSLIPWSRGLTLALGLYLFRHPGPI